jgi:hypothetical protein
MTLTFFVYIIHGSPDLIFFLLFFHPTPDLETTIKAPGTCLPAPKINTFFDQS